MCSKPFLSQSEITLTAYVIKSCDDALYLLQTANVLPRLELESPAGTVAAVRALAPQRFPLHGQPPFQVLRHFDDSPQMPTGYPGMIMLSLVPPLWFAVMNPRVNRLREKYPEHLAVAA